MSNLTERKNHDIRKAQEAIAILPKSGRITLLTRKFFSVLLHAAQEDGHQSVYRRKLSEILGMASFDSHNTEVAKEQLRTMTGIQVEWNSVGPKERRWGISSLLAEVEIVERDRSLWIEWSYGEKIRAKLLDPEMYARISLQAYSRLRSSASAALYEICARYITNPSGLTNRAPWGWWRPRLTGNPEDAAEETEYKFFKRDVLKPAIAEVNGLADISVELIEHKDGRKVAEIQFRVERVKQAHLDIADTNLVDSVLIDRLVLEIGLPKDDAAKIYSQHEESFLKASIELTLQRDADRSLPSLQSRAAYFKSSIRGKYALNAQPKKPSNTPKQKVKEPEPLPDPEKTAARELAIFTFNALPSEEQKAMLVRFASTLRGPAAKAYAKSGLEHPLTGPAFAGWLMAESLSRNYCNLNAN